MQSILISLLFFIPGSWPIVSCPRDYEFLPGKCKLMILKGCRHHIAGLRCRLAEESLCSLPTHSSLSFPGQFVLSQFVVALGSDKQELFECYMEASRNGNFKIVSNASMVLVGKASSLVHLRDSRSINNVRDHQIQHADINKPACTNIILCIAGSLLQSHVQDQIQCEVFKTCEHVTFHRTKTFEKNTEEKIGYFLQAPNVVLLERIYVTAKFKFCSI